MSYQAYLDRFNELYAVPGRTSIIDMIDSQTGLTQSFGSTEAEVLAREPGAVRMTWADWQAAQAERQHTPIRWERTTKAQYWEMLEVLPPALWIGGGFLVGEPMDHDVTNGQPRFSAYWEFSEKIGANGELLPAEYYVASRPLTRAELRAELDGSR